MGKPRKAHWTTLQRILRYLSSTMLASVKISKIKSMVLKAYTDADWAGDTTNQRSHGGYWIFLGNNLVNWKSTKQPTIARSSTEAEFRSLADGAAEMNWMDYVRF